MPSRKRIYSRLAQVEEKKAKRAVFIYGGLTLGLVILVVFFGFGLASRFANIINRSGSSNNPIAILDNTPPAPPKLESASAYTNKDKINISGSAESGTTITLKINGNTKEVITDADGRFSTSTELNKGENTISAKATDQAGNESAISNTLTIIHDNEAPELTITKPVDGESFSGKTKQISVEGTTDPNSSVTINDRVVIVGSTGRFTYSYSLSEGENTLTIKATDQAGNEIEETLTVSYSP